MCSVPESRGRISDIIQLSSSTGGTSLGQAPSSTLVMTGRPPGFRGDQPLLQAQDAGPGCPSKGEVSRLSPTWLFWRQPKFLWAKQRWLSGFKEPGELASRPDT